MPNLLDRVLRIGEGKILRQLEGVAAACNAIEPEFTDMSDAELRAMTDELRARYADGESLDDLMPEAFATVREAARRVLGLRPYDVQLMGGASLHRGNIAEMRTGEGKTLVATLPAYLNALAGQGVHVVTVNDYLATYQSEMMGRVFSFLGMSVGVVVPSLNPTQRRAAYACDVTYATNNELGFDYLRDNMATDASLRVQRGHFFAIVDEVDSILIDEARTPLIISGPTNEEVKWYAEFARIVSLMEPGTHYDVDEKKKTVSVSEAGIDLVERQLGIDNLYEPENTPLISFMNNAIKAEGLFHRDREYVVLDGEVLIVDEHTGRILSGRRYSDGLHQAIEAKEGVRVQNENQTLATITLQNYFRLYSKLSGMTGTAMTEVSEFARIYNLGVTEIRPNKPLARIDQPDVVFRTEEAKFKAVVADIAERHAKGQPVLVGTTSVQQSERLGTLLTAAGVPHSVLNAKHHDAEAKIIALAGHKGAVTVATNMAGRGTDIMLGGSVEFLADEQLRARGLLPTGETAEEYNAQWSDTVARVSAEVEAEAAEVRALGGLYVVGTERHESRRIDNQLRGRSGRQGDPGESRFYLSLGDDLMRLFKSDWVERVLQVLNIPDDVPIEAKRVSNAIASAQAQVEGANFESRKNILKYDDVMDRQRKVVYAERRLVLDGADLREQMLSFIDDVIEAMVAAVAEGYPEDWDVEALWAELDRIGGVDIAPSDLDELVGGRRADWTRSFLVENLRAEVLAAYEEREATVGPEIMRQIERQLMLSVLDQKWRDHLYEMDYLREGIGLRSYSQRDPLVEYQREGYDMFASMINSVKLDTLAAVMRAEISFTEDAGLEEELSEFDSAPDDDTWDDGLEELVPVGPDGEPLDDEGAVFPSPAPERKFGRADGVSSWNHHSYAAPEDDER